MAGELRVTVEPWGPDPDRIESAARAALQHADVRSELDGAEARLVALQLLDPPAEPTPARAVRATVYDYASERTLLLDVPLDGDGTPTVASSARQPLPSAEEFDDAVALVGDDPDLGPALRDGRLLAYRSMPPLAGEEAPDGTIARTVTVGLKPAEGDAGHEIVGVRLGRREVVRYEEKAPPRSRAAPRVCGLPDAGQTTTRSAVGAARVTVTRDGETLWSLIVVRPAASSGSDGSAVELRGVTYRGRRVLRRAHVPILNVRYDDDACGPFRDWQHEEGRFQAQGAGVAPGFRLCPAPATTVLETGVDHGNFRGVAVYVDGDEVVLVSELEAGWYRYVSRWRLHADGTIRPRFGFGAVENSCVCERHHHHVYWRLDFDIGGAGRDVVLEHNDPPLAGHDTSWHTLKHEIRRRRNAAHKRRWRVRNQGTNEGYILVPGTGDGEADSYGVGDFWALRYRSGQLDDSAVATGTRAHIDSFVNHESIVGTNVVVWYAAHFSHDVAHEDDDRHDNHIVGPTLRPDRW